MTGLIDEHTQIGTMLQLTGQSVVSWDWTELAPAANWSLTNLVPGAIGPRTDLTPGAISPGTDSARR